LVENLYTETSKRVGQERLAYYKDFLDRLDKEVVGEL